MAKVISSLSVVLGASVSPFVNGFKKAGSAATGLVSSVGSAGKSLLKFGSIGALAGAAAAGAVGYLVHNQLEAIDGAAKLADRLGLSTEALAGLKHASDLSGVSNETLASSFTKMQKNMVDAADGGKETSEAFAAIGLNAQDLVNLPTEQAFSKIADGLNGIQNISQRSALQMKIFGKSGAEMAPLLAEGSKGLAAFKDEANALGLAFNRMDAAKVEEANDAVSRVKSAFTGVFTQIAVAVAPALAAVATQMTEWGKSVVTIVKTYLPVAIQYAASVWGWLTSFVGNAWTAIYNFVAPIVMAIVQWIAANWKSALTRTIAYYTSIYNFVSSILTAVWGVVTSIASSIAGAWNWAMGLMGVSTSDAGITVSGVFQSLYDWGVWLQEGITLAFNMAAWSIQNFGTIVAWVLTSAAYEVVKIGNEIEYQFTVVIPGVLTWLWDNWRDIFQTIWNFTKSVFVNLGKNIGNFASALWSFLSGDGFNFEFTGLTEGFETSIKKLPQIAEREIGPLEKALGDEANNLGESLSVGLSDYLTQQEQQAKDATKGIEDMFSGMFEGAGDFASKPPEIKVNAQPAIDEMDDYKQAMESTKAAEQSFAGLVKAGSAEAFQLRAQAFSESRRGTNTAASAPPQSSAPRNSGADQSDKSPSLLKDVIALLTSGNATRSQLLKALEDFEQMPVLADSLA